MKNKAQDPRLRMFCLYIKFCILLLVSCALPFSILYAQEKDEDEDRIIDLPTVKIEIVDTTQLSIPREKFSSFTKPDPLIYAPLDQKERPWYLPSVSIPDKLRETPVPAGEDSLFSLTAQFGIPTALAYQALLVRGFGSSEIMVDVGRSSPKEERTAKLAGSDSSEVGLGSSNIDSFKGAFAYQKEKSSLKIGVQYDSRDLGYLDEDGKEFANVRSLTNLSAGWGQRLSMGARPFVNVSFSSLKLEGPLSPGGGNGMDLRTDLGVEFLRSRSNPINAGLKIGYFTGDNDSEDFKEAILRLYLEDNQVRVSPFVLGLAIELAFDTRSSSTEDGKWEPAVYANPRVLIATQVGRRTSFELGAKGYTLTQDLRYLYLDKDYVRFAPNVSMEQGWEASAALKYRMASKLTAEVTAFGKAINNLTILGETEKDEGTEARIMSWKPGSQDRSIFGFYSRWELSLLNDRFKQRVEYIHESYDEDIPYRPNDRGSLSVKYLAPFGLELSLAGDFYGKRQVDTKGSNQLSLYFLLRPGISKTFGKYASVFVKSEIHVGKDQYQVWKGYELPNRTVDFGLTAKL